MRSLVMRDTETGTEWAHLLGKGMVGKLKDKELKPLITDMVTWKAWKERHPETTVLGMTPVTTAFTRSFYRSPEEFVFGFEVNGKPRALPMAKMLQNPVHHFDIDERPLVATFDREGAGTHLYEARLNDEVLSFTQLDELTMTDSQSGSKWHLRDGTCFEGPMKGKALRQRVGIMSFRLAWKNFHPETQDIAFPPER